MATSPTPPSRHSRFALRFSLRVLLIAFTAFAVGFPIWYRWPYEESQDETYPGPADPFAAPGTTPPPAIKSTLVTTWQRQWGRGRLKHGPERWYENGKLVVERTFINGELHGPHQAAGTRKLRFARDQLISVDGQTVVDRLGQLLASGQIDNPQVAAALLSQTDVEFVETPLMDGVNFLMVKHQVPMVVDRHHGDRQRPITGQLRGVQLSSALAILMAVHEHACDYRYGMIWITSAKDAKDWHDPTGVSEIEPPRNSQFAKLWNRPVDIDAVDKPLTEALEKLSQDLAIDFDTSAIEAADKDTDEHTVRLRLVGHPMRHGLGILLYQARCRSELRGETLVILSQE